MVSQIGHDAFWTCTGREKALFFTTIHEGKSASFCFLGVPIIIKISDMWIKNLPCVQADYPYGVKSGIVGHKTVSTPTKITIVFFYVWFVWKIVFWCGVMILWLLFDEHIKRRSFLPLPPINGLIIISWLEPCRLLLCIGVFFYFLLNRSFLDDYFFFRFNAYDFIFTVV